MLSEKDLIFFGAILFRVSGRLYGGQMSEDEKMNVCIDASKKIFDKVFNQDNDE